MPSKPEVIKERKKNDPEYAERLRSYTRKYREKNLESERERDRKSVVIKRSDNRDAYNAYMREWTARNKDRLNTERRERLLTDLEYAERVRASGRARPKPQIRSNRLNTIYGITLAEYHVMYANQEGKCSICRKSKPDHGRTGLVVDHCHNKGHIRGLLCSGCNNGLGRFKDDVVSLTNAIEYLKSNGAKASSN